MNLGALGGPHPVLPNRKLGDNLDRVRRPVGYSDPIDGREAVAVPEGGADAACNLRENKPEHQLKLGLLSAEAAGDGHDSGIVGAEVDRDLDRGLG